MALLRLLLASPLALLVSACTYVEVPYGADDTTAVVARAMELGGHQFDDVWRVEALPRGWTYPACPFAPHTSPRFASKHGFVGVVAYPTPELVNQTGFPEMFNDGMNEHGLMASANIFVGAKFGAPRDCGTSSDGTTVIEYNAFLPWALSQHATVAELVAALPRVRVIDFVGDLAQKTSELHIHWAVRDKSGASVVIESLNGTGVVHVWNNSLGVLTNDPPFDLQVTNTAQYAPLSNGFVRTMNTPKEDAQPFVPQPRGHGYNLIGLPGDLSPASRFVRTFVHKHLAVTNNRPKTVDDAIVLGAHLLNAVDITEGTVGKNDPLDVGDWTVWVVIKSPTTGLYMWKSMNNTHWQSINMSDLATFFLTSSEPRSLKVFTPGFGNLDVTSALLQSAVSEVQF
jgi:choloylglycine hydrolase